VRTSDSQASTGDLVVLTHRGRSAAVLVSWERHEAMLDAVEDLEDRLAAAEHTAGKGLPAHAR
jgi:PHD/YefM family antitoxin component YafN of YafNO toxin-antitoxin module